MYPGNPMGWGNSGWLWWMPMGLMMLLFWGVVIVALVLLARHVRRPVERAERADGHERHRDGDAHRDEDLDERESPGL